MCLAAFVGLLTSCGPQTVTVKSYNEGINIIPMPAELQQREGKFTLTSGTSFYASTPETKKIAEFFIGKLNLSTGYHLVVSEKEKSNSIALVIDPSQPLNAEGYLLDVTPKAIKISATTPQGLFYGMESMMQLLPAEVESKEVVTGVDWDLPCVSIKDQPRFAYRGFMLDACRHFIPVEDVKKQLDAMALFKVNTMHWHLTEDQGWRIEIKKYPRLAEIASKRIDGEGTEYGGYYTQEEIKEIVAYAAERFITIVPEIEIPGHELAAIAAYPNLSCKGAPITPRIIWGVEDIVMCPGKEDMFRFLEDVIAEVAPLFPGKYFHIGGDECPKTSWKQCPACQARIRQEGLYADHQHSAEEKLQSYVIGRMEKVLATYGKDIIGWDEILEGGLSPNATVMSWRGEKGGIAAALQDHNVIMTPSSNGLYTDYYQGDKKIEPVGIGGYTTLEKIYAYNPVPDTLKTIGKDQYIAGVQCNTWSEYLYRTDLLEYRMYPRALALSEIAWTPLEKKDLNDFYRRVNNAYVRLDGHKINYHIPQPEQPKGSCNFIAFTDSATLTFTTTRPEKMVYTVDNSEPTAESSAYAAPLTFTATTTLKIRTVLPSGKTSPVRTITVEKQTFAPAQTVENTLPGLKLKTVEGNFLKPEELDAVDTWKDAGVKALEQITKQVPTTEDMRGVPHYAAIAEGYVDIPADGVYYFSSNYDQVWLDGKLLIDNEGEVKRFSRHDSSAALAAGLHSLKIVFLGNIIGGWPSQWDSGSIAFREAGQEKFMPIAPAQLSHAR